MSHWWEIANEPAMIRPKAVAYYRHSAQDRQEEHRVAEGLNASSKPFDNARGRVSR